MKVPVPAAGSRISTCLVDQRFAKMLLAQPVGALDHEAHDFVRRVDHAEPVGRLRVVDLVETLVDDLEKSLLLVVAADLLRGRADGVVIGLEPSQRVLLQRAGEEHALQRIELLRDVVLAVEIVLVEDLGENLLGQDVLDQHLPHVGSAVTAGLIVSCACLRNFGGGVAEGGIVASAPFRSLRAALRAQPADRSGTAPPPCGTRRSPAARSRRTASSSVSSCRVVHRAAHHLLPVLDQDGGEAVLENDVVLRIAAGGISWRFPRRDRPSSSLASQ